MYIFFLFTQQAANLILTDEAARDLSHILIDNRQTVDTALKQAPDELIFLKGLYVRTQMSKSVVSDVFLTFSFQPPWWHVRKKSEWAPVRIQLDVVWRINDVSYRKTEKIKVWK